MRSLIVASVVVLVPGCMLFFDGGGKRPDKCDLPVSEDTRGGDGAGIAPLALRDPDRLVCESFGGPMCDPDCGPCPAIDLGGGAELAPIPSWGQCGSSCETLTEDACAASTECRVVRDARCAIGANCITDFVGCFPLDTAPDPSVNCFAARDGWECSRNAACTALHDTAQACPPSIGDCPRPFGLCVPEGASPGRCHEQAVCDSAGPSCPSGTIAGVANGCFTGACIPLSLCENAF